MQRFVKNEEGVCPACGSDEGLDFDSAEIADGHVKYPWTCEKCQATGDEFYEMNFVGHENVTDKDGKSIANLDGKGS